MSNSSRAPSSSRGEVPSSPQSSAGCLLQFAWSLGGFAVLLILWLIILREGAWTFTWKDAVYWAAVLGMIAARHLDFARYGGITADNKPATRRHVRLYALILLVGAGLAWAAAQSFDA